MRSGRRGDVYRIDLGVGEQRVDVVVGSRDAVAPREVFGLGLVSTCGSPPGLCYFRLWTLDRVAFCSAGPDFFSTTSPQPMMPQTTSFGLSVLCISARGSRGTSARQPARKARWVSLGFALTRLDDQLQRFSVINSDLGAEPRPWLLVLSRPRPELAACNTLAICAR